MNASVKGAVVLGVLVAILGLAFTLSGSHTKPSREMFFVGLAIVLNIGIVVWALRATAAENGFGKQVLAALVLGLVASVIIVASSWTMTSIVFPSYYDEMIAGYSEAYKASGMSEAEVEEKIAPYRQVTPLISALGGAVGTLSTSLVVGAIGGIFLRRKD